MLTSNLNNNDVLPFLSFFYLSSQRSWSRHRSKFADVDCAKPPSRWPKAVRTNLLWRAYVCYEIQTLSRDSHLIGDENRSRLLVTFDRLACLRLLPCISLCSRPLKLNKISFYFQILQLHYGMRLLPNDVDCCQDKLDNPSWKPRNDSWTASLSWQAISCVCLDSQYTYTDFFAYSAAYIVVFCKLRGELAYAVKVMTSSHSVDLSNATFPRMWNLTSLTKSRAWLLSCWWKHRGVCGLHTPRILRVI